MHGHGEAIRTRAGNGLGLDINPGWLAHRPEHAAGEALPRPRVLRDEDPEQLALAVHIGERLVAERQARGWSQQNLADLIGVDRTAVGRWERGSRTIPLHRLIAAARLFELPVEALLPEAEGVMG